MAFQDFRKPRSDGTPPPPPPSRGPGELSAFIDQGSEFSGKLSFRDTVRIDGRFEGEISSDNTLIVGESGQIHAEIHSEVVIVSGEVEGDIFAARQITLHKTARVRGDLRTQTILIEDGAQLNGRVDTGADAVSKSGAPGSKGSAAGEKKKPEDRVVALRDGERSGPS